MAFERSGTRRITAAANHLWPSLAKCTATSWRASVLAAASSTIATRPPRSTTAVPAGPFQRTNPPISFPNPGQSKTFAAGMSRIRFGNSRPEITRRLFQTVVSRPLGAWTPLRTLITYQREPIFSFRWLLQTRTTQSQQQYRVFGTGGVSHSLLANREAAANRNPGSATAQNAFYQALLKANMPAIIIERYRSGHFARNEVTTQTYHLALNMLNGNPATAGVVGASTAPNDGGLGVSQGQIVGQAVAAHTQGGNHAVSQTGTNVDAKREPVHVIVDEAIGNLVFRWFRFICWFGLFTYVSLALASLLVDGLSLLKRPGSRLEKNEVKAENQKARFSDVHGCDEAKEELQDLVEFLRNPNKFNALGGKLPKGVLLEGPPGTGKTLLARAVAGEAGVPFFYMSGSEFDEIFVGVGAKRVRELFASAKAKAPSIVFIDELDAIGSKRNSRDAAYVKQTLNQLLTELDGFEQNSGVVIIGATNFPDILDKALTRPGRFDRHVSVELPDVRGRLAILQHHAKKVKMASDVQLNGIAGFTSGLSGADLESIVNQAAIRASKAQAKVTTQADLEWAKDKVLMGAERKNMVITAREKEMTAYHEAGHALVSLYAADVGASLYKVTILPRGRTLGHTARLPEEHKYSYRVRDYRGTIEVMMGGKVAEELAFGVDNVTSGCSSDLASATRAAYAMVASLGMSDALGNMQYASNYETLSGETKQRIEKEVRRIVDDSYNRARQLLTDKRKELDLLAKALCEYETLDLAEVKKVIRGEKLPDRISAPPGPMTVPKPGPSFDENGIPPLPGQRPVGGQDGSGGTAPPPPAPTAAGGLAA